MSEEKKHIFLAGSADTSLFTSTSTGGKPPKCPSRDRASHGSYIKQRLEQAWEQVGREREARKAVAVPTRHGTYLEFESSPGFDLKTESLENLPSGIRLLNIRTTMPILHLVGEESATVTKALVYIPAGQEGFFLERVRQYLHEETGKYHRPKNQKLIESVQEIHLALAEALWTDDKSLLPGQSPVVCEVWLQGDNPEVETEFRNVARRLDIPVQTGSLRFPERTVLLANANREQLGQLLSACDSLAEFRRAKETAEFWTESENVDQVEWSRSLLDRLETTPEAGVAVSVLDTGVNNGHLLLAPLLDDEDLHTCDPTWGVHDDHRGHGTLMCGLAGYGNLQQALEDNGPVHVGHILESVKILPPNSQNHPDAYGYLTAQAASRVEIKAPKRKHVFCLAVTSEDGRDRGKPTSWSAALDSLASGQDIGQLAPGATDPTIERARADEKRLIIVSAGNVNPNDWKSYPDSNLVSSAHDPAQSWNALTVGAYTEKTFITNPDLSDYQSVALSGGLSPFSSTSLTWDDNKWPNKPDILLEGGNVVRDSAGFCSTCDDTSLLSTSHEPTLRQFGTIHATSASTAQAAWMAARIQTLYPQAWPETVRGLLVHSARWTKQMEQSFLDAKNKTDYARLLRVCGYGVPDLQRAMYCASNRLTLIAQDSLQPFDKKEKGSGYRTKDMHLHKLPWPKEALEDLGETELTLRITLSYFIEPGPGEVGWKDRYRYQSHALRFDLNAPWELDERQFLARLNKAARDDGEAAETSSGSERWIIGSTARSRGSIHSDIWKGTAVQLAACNLIGVYPVIGWWRERAWLGSWNKQARYSLIVSLHAPELNVDIYTPVAVATETAVTIPNW